MNLVHRLSRPPPYPGDRTGDDGHHKQQDRRVLHVDPDEVAIHKQPVEKVAARAEQNHCRHLLTITDNFHKPKHTRPKQNAINTNKMTHCVSLTHSLQAVTTSAADE